MINCLNYYYTKYCYMLLQTMQDLLIAAIQ